jgi:hypothetical protein
MLAKLRTLRTVCGLRWRDPRAHPSRPEDQSPLHSRPRMPAAAGRRKGAARPCGMGLRPTLPPTRCSRMEAGCGSGQESVDRRHRHHVTSLPRGVGTAAGSAGSTVGSASSRRVPPAIQSCVTLAIAAAPQASTMSRSRDRIFGVLAAPLLIVGEGGPTRSSDLHVGVAAKSSGADPTGTTSPARALNSNPQ